ncbi:MAG: hypothetical protein R3D28_11545 [Geminicoccaceae bacterium]|jgi:hypothetical protein
MVEKRLHTAYVQRRRYRRIGRSAAVAGGVLGGGMVGLALGRAYAAGEPVPAASWVVGVAIVALAALVPWALVRWRWRSLRRELVDEG